MKIYAEVYPSKNLDAIKSTIQRMDAFDGFNIPDNPLGYPTMPPELVGYIIRERFPNKDIIINQRLKDINELKIRSIIVAAGAINASIIFTQGDKPRYGMEYSSIDSARAMKLAIHRGISSGLILSFRRPLREILERLQLCANIFLVVNFENISILEHMETSRLIPYIIVKTGKNKNIIEKINQPYVDLDELYIYMGQFRKFNLNGVLFSVPGDNDALLNIKDNF